MSTSIDARAHKVSCCHYLGKMNVSCPYCSTLHWMFEKLTKLSMKHPLFGTCYLKGKIRLPFLITPSPPLHAINAFMSLGATLDPRVLSGKGLTSFIIQGELCHRTGSLQPQLG